MVGIIIAGHGNFATGMASAIETIAGEQDKMATVIFPGNSTTDILRAELERALTEIESEEVLICADIAGGTPFNNAVLLSQHSDKNIKIVSGVNIPVMLEAVLGRKDKTAAELAEMMCNNKQGKVMLYTPSVRKAKVQNGGI